MPHHAGLVAGVQGSRRGAIEAAVEALAGILHMHAVAPVAHPRLQACDFQNVLQVVGR